MAKILLLEDDSNLNETICEFLENHGHEVISVYDGYDAQDRLYESAFDLLLLDVNTPNIDGFDLLKEARTQNMTSPTIFITARSSIEDLERGFQVGCDDYIRKPFLLKELLIRVERLLKRNFFHVAQNFLPIAKGIGYDIKNSTLVVHGEHRSLGKKESVLLKLFLEREGEIVAHEEIYKYLWDFDEAPSDTALRTYIKNLRKLIGKERIVSIKKQGYKFSTQE
jgi:DNA-binding response OmpR family regulator